MRIPSLYAITAALCCACAGSPAVSPVAAPEPVAAPATAPPPEGEPISVCVYKDGALANIAVTYDLQTGDTLVDGRPFAEVHPTTTPPYAAGADWFVRDEPFDRDYGPPRRAVKYGLPRTLSPWEITPVKPYRGVAVFAEAGITGEPEVIYVLVRPGCVFQPYQSLVDVGAVRG
ncbi:hypothetical protein [Longimicrobium terrae]|uniref:Uncharacterized protein n=1 Tax=Longimicrobium terrae TaxID=1639882 RepID=A0A841GUW0_9BACT|nr:hypothetical protein [Longimicrobium terrae]MBB4634197.1 hypothetical protein [Longimicrobium terrae]MBB6068913.1 hypothetical protein [Longimicrobium terrae]NNC28093.1 hypothetical protein [Longimicrobium terrae]